MLFRAPLLAAAAALLGHQVSAHYIVCDAGYYIDTSLNCQNCPDGHVNSNSVYSNTATSCTPCSAGKGSNSSRTMRADCGTGEFSTEVTANDALLVKPPRPLIMVAKSARLEITHLPVARAACPKGTFNNVVGAKSCWIFLPQLPDYTTSCGMVADNVCPNPTGNGPQGTAISRKRRDVQCTKGFEACPLYSGKGGFDCVDTENDPESCVGCLDLDGEGPGTDCTAIEGVSVTRCVKRSCVVDSCRKGWVKSLDSTSCVSDSHPVHVQAKKRRSSAKRAIRGNRDIF